MESGEISQWMDLRGLIEFARTRNFDINEITVSPEKFKELLATVQFAEAFEYRADLSVLKYRDITINKRECKGCCSHRK